MYTCRGRVRFGLNNVKKKKKLWKVNVYPVIFKKYIYIFTRDQPTTVSNGIIKITYTCRSPYGKRLSAANDAVLKSREIITHQV